MYRTLLTLAALAVLTAQVASQGQAPQIETKKVEGTENVSLRCVATARTPKVSVA